MSNILYLFIGLISGYTISYLRSKILNKEDSISRRRGLYRHRLTSTDRITKATESIEVNAEILELESTDKKSKIRVINIITDKSDYNTDVYLKSIHKMIDNTWINSSEIEWITSSKSSIRNEKINSILS